MKTLEKNFIYNVLYQLLVIVLPLITAPYIARTLGAESVGIYSYTYSVAQYFLLFAMLGISTHGNRCVASVKNDRDKLSNTFCSIKDIATKNVLVSINAPKATMDFGYMKYPVFCMFRYDERNKLSETTEDGQELFGFSPEQVRYMPEFGDSVLVIKDADEFIRRVATALQKEGLIHARGNVRYFDGNDLEYFQDVKDEPVHTAFWKRKKYSYQQEFRILIDKPIEDHYILNIGDISDISKIMKSELMLNTVATLEKRK